MNNRHPNVQKIFEFLKSNGIPFRIRNRLTSGGRRRKWIEIPLDRVIEPDKNTDGEV